MDTWLADGFFTGTGQSAHQIIELAVAFGLTALIGLERETRGKSAGLRTQTIVGTSSALILLVSKYGFGDGARSSAHLCHDHDSTERRTAR
jgi:putative Mg2+ transporter-C (MgtC) family protein